MSLLFARSNAQSFPEEAFQHFLMPILSYKTLTSNNSSGKNQFMIAPNKTLSAMLDNLEKLFTVFSPGDLNIEGSDPKYDSKQGLYIRYFHTEFDED